MKNIKLIIGLLSIFVSTLSYSQVVIGGEVGSGGADNTSVLLDFPTGKKKGIIVPYIRATPEAQEGAIILDARVESATRVKYYNGSTWVDLSGKDAEASVITAALDDQPSEPIGGGSETGMAIIGAETTSAKGALVLESSTRAMVLPKVESVQDIVNPSPGMLVYVTGKSSPDASYNRKRLAVFNGSTWAFWAPEQ